MIETKDFKIAESKEEALISGVMEKIEKDSRNMKLTLEINDVILQYLKTKTKGDKK